MSHFFWLMLTLIVVLLGIGYVVAVTRDIKKSNSELIIAEIVLAKQTLKNEVELVRIQRDGDTDEMRYQNTQIKDRLTWMILQYDRLREAIEKHAKEGGVVGQAAVKSSDVTDG